MVKLKPIVQQVVVIVGATSGIGLETARRFARRGARLVLAGRGTADLAATLDEIRSEGADGITVEADVADWNQVKHIADKAIETYGRIDTWAHVAGVAYFAKIEDTTPGDFRRVVEVNLNGPAYGILAALPHMKQEGRGAIIIVSSIDARVAVPYQGAYSASKHGLEGLIDGLRMELKHDRIPVSLTSILPASVNTPFFAKGKTRTGFKPNAMPPVYSPASVADAILYAAEHPIREITVGGVGLLYQANKRLSPRMQEISTMALAFRGQETNQRKSPDNPGNLYEHQDGYHRIQGEFDERYSKYSWLQTHPMVRRALLLMVAIPAGYLILRRMRRPQNRPQRLLNRVVEIVGIGALLSRLRGQRASLPQRITRRGRGWLPGSVLPGQKSTFEKLRAKAQELAPKWLVAQGSRETFPEKIATRAKDIVPDRIKQRSGTRQERSAEDLKENIATAVSGRVKR